MKKRQLLGRKDDKLRWKCGDCGVIVSCDEKWAGREAKCPACEVETTFPSSQEMDEHMEGARFRFQLELFATIS